MAEDVTAYSVTLLAKRCVTRGCWYYTDLPICCTNDGKALSCVLYNIWKMIINRPPTWVYTITSLFIYFAMVDLCHDFFSIMLFNLFKKFILWNKRFICSHRYSFFLKWKTRMWIYHLQNIDYHVFFPVKFPVWYDERNSQMSPFLQQILSKLENFLLFSWKCFSMIHYKFLLIFIG